jgi:methyl-accepting chemotaxis protein
MTFTIQEIRKIVEKSKKSTPEIEAELKETERKMLEAIYSLRSD